MVGALLVRGVDAGLALLVDLELYNPHKLRVFFKFDHLTHQNYVFL